MITMISKNKVLEQKAVDLDIVAINKSIFHVGNRTGVFALDHKSK
jgi:hypothetical protein